MHPATHAAGGHAPLHHENAGADLGDAFADGETVEFRQFEAMSRTLKAMHQKGLYHLDIKPTNMTIDGAGGLHLIDFDGLVQPKGENITEVPMTRLFMGPNATLETYKQNDEYAFLLSMTMLEFGRDRVDDVRALSAAVVSICCSTSSTVMSSRSIGTGSRTS